ncbi:hypothetical protein D3C81_1259480 [compost metagenome]
MRRRACRQYIHAGLFNRAGPFVLIESTAILRVPRHIKLIGYRIAEPLPVDFVINLVRHLFDFTPEELPGNNHAIQRQCGINS